MNNEKSWYEKVGIWITIFAGIFGILGVSIFGGKGIIGDGTQQTTTSDNFVNLEKTELYETEETMSESISTNQHSEEIVSEEQLLSVKQEASFESNSEEHDNSEEIGTPFVISSPQQDGVTNAYIVSWDEENDRDIIGNTYSSAIKLSVYNMINAIGGGSDNIVADIHFPLGEKFSGTCIFTFVVAKDMVGNGSSAEVTILSGEEELFPSFTIDSATTEELSYKIDLNGIRDLVLRFDCNAVGNGLCVGIVIEDE